jgi:hypothetical protein
MFLPEGLGLHEDRRVGTGPAGRPVIGGRGRLSAVVLGESEQVVDSAKRQAKSLSQGMGAKPPLMDAEKGLTDGDGDGTRHRTKLLRCASDTDQ